MTEESKDRYVKLGSLQLEMIWCQPGEFIMGCSEDEEGDSEDAQLHSVTLTRGFWLGRYQVTQAEYDTLAAAAGVPPSPSKYVGERRPVERVTWVNAVKWCQELTKREREAHRLPEGYEYRLPTEAEWEYACRAGTTTALNNGKILTSGNGECPNLNEVAWYDKNSGSETHDVGQKLPNRWGVYDMHGNVEEWCWDWYDEYSAEAVVDPKGPDVGRYRVCRGGNMGGMAMGCSSSARKGGNTMNRRCYRGFRLALGPALGVSLEDALATPHQPQQRVQAVPENQPSMEELAQMRVEMEERLKVNRPFAEAISGDEAVQGSRNFLIDDLCMKMIWCPAGTFQMGSPETEPGRNNDEMLHGVTLTRGFWMGMYEVTQEEYSLIADCAGLRPRPANFAGLRRPIETVDYESVLRWCRELTYLEFISGRLPEGYVYRLPTEAEWEYACRAGTTTIFNHAWDETKGEEARKLFELVGWYKYNSGYKSHVVGERQANAWGFCDMHGNVREWCMDWYGEYPDGPATDPHGPAEGTLRVTRGGCYGDYPRHCRSAYRGSIEPVASKANIGFRVVLAPEIR